MIKKIIFAATLIAVGSGAPALAGEQLTGDELRGAVVGKTVYLRTQGVEIPITYNGSGTMNGKLKAFVAALAGGEKTHDTGKWWISNHQLCQRWNSWLDGKSYCYKLSQAGSQVQWHRNDGRSGTARIGG
jgi:hypothetical protein